MKSIPELIDWILWRLYLRLREFPLGFHAVWKAFVNWVYLVADKNQDTETLRQWVFYWMGEEETPEDYPSGQHLINLNQC